MDTKAQKLMYGNTFEKLGQERRLNVMRAVGLLDDNTHQKFSEIRSIRKKYLHYFSRSHKQIASDARKSWVITRDLLVQVFDIKFENGKLMLAPLLLRYLSEKSQTSS